MVDTSLPNAAIGERITSIVPHGIGRHLHLDAIMKNTTVLLLSLTLLLCLPDDLRSPLHRRRRVKNFNTRLVHVEFQLHLRQVPLHIALRPLVVQAALVESLLSSPLLKNMNLG